MKPSEKGNFWEVLRDGEYCALFCQESEAKACCILFQNAQLFGKPKMQAQILEFRK